MQIHQKLRIPAMLKSMTIASETPRRSRFRRIVDSFFGSPFAPTQLPVLADATIDPEKVRSVARVRLLAELGTREVRQVTYDVLVNQDAMLSELRTSIEDRCILWVLECPSNQHFTNLENALPGLIRVIGSHANGHDILGIHTASVMRFILSEHRDKLHVLDDIDTAFLPRDIEKSLKNTAVPLHHTAWLERKLREPKSWVYMAIFIYSALRALPVIFVPQFHGSIFWLWTIDIVTAIPYTWGLLTMFTAPKFRLRLVGFVTTVVTFMAPYVYFWFHGDDYPKTVTTFVVMMIVLSVASEVWRYINEQRLKKAYVAT